MIIAADPYMATFAGPETFEPANETPPLIAFIVQVKRGKEVLQQFEAMGTSSMAVGVQHEGLCDHERGEYVNVRKLTDADRWHQANDRRALLEQINRPDALSLILRGAER